MMSRIVATAALCALCVLAGCRAPAGSQNTYSGGEGTPEMARAENNTFLRDSLWILNPRTRRQDGRLEVQFDLQNKRATNLRFAWAVSWFDSNGFQVADGTYRWEPVTLGGHGKKTLTITAPNPAATSWQLEVTTPNEVQ